MEYELKVTINGKTVTRKWEGKDGLNASERYSDCHPGHVVTAWRDIPYGLFNLGDARQIVG